MKVAVIGAGVSGLSCGIKLLELGFETEILTREVTPNTTSDAASAVWYPYRVGPKKRVAAWVETTRRELGLLSREPESGVLPIPIRYYHSKTAPPPWWAKDIETISGDELLGSFSSGYRHETYLLETLKYMPYLRHRFETSGGKVFLEEIKSISDLESRYPIVVNCTGVWAGGLSGDRSVYPIRGQVLRIRPRRAMTPAFFDTEFGSLCCRSADCIIGGANADNDWSLAPRTEERKRLLGRAVGFWPELNDSEIIEDRVGLRPGRETVRLEAEQLAGRFWVVHNYGHGGAGFSCSWGCADEVAKIVLKLSSP